ncbi:MAG: ATP-binding cassette domain-containing protein [Candidatus Cloacimonetes bacterium]|nr:ATP-binding cassette domain-containing protein [Candidatus Cloacimonadota bacterium]
MSLKLENISLSFNGNNNLLSISDIGFSLGIHCLWGVSGSGKTSFLRLVAGRPFECKVCGNLKIDSKTFCLSSDTDMANFNDKYVSALYQDNFLIDDFDVKENLLLPYFLHRDDYDVSELNYLLDQLKLEHLLSKDITQISRGEAQRVRIARALLFSKKILVLDEPLVYLDKDLKAKCFDLIKSWVDDKKLISFFSTHDQNLKESTDFTSIIKFEDGLEI